MFSDPLSFFPSGLSLVLSSYNGEDVLVAFGGYNGLYNNEVNVLKPSHKSALQSKIMETPVPDSVSAVHNATNATRDLVSEFETGQDGKIREIVMDNVDSDPRFLLWWFEFLVEECHCSRNYWGTGVYSCQFGAFLWLEELQIKVAMEAAVSDINADQGIFKGTELKFIMLDSMCNVCMGSIGVFSRLCLWYQWMS